nr:immunoglobulin heavy chain junction region [Mus musculus]
LLCTITTVPL